MALWALTGEKWVGMDVGQQATEAKLALMRCLYGQRMVCFSAAETVGSVLLLKL